MNALDTSTLARNVRVDVLSVVQLADRPPRVAAVLTGYWRPGARPRGWQGGNARTVRVEMVMQ